MDDEIPKGWERERAQPLPDSLRPCAAAVHEHGHVRAELEPEGGESTVVEPGLPYPVEGNEGGRRIGAAATEPGSRWDPLGEADRYAPPGRGPGAQQLGGADRELVPGIEPGGRVEEHDALVAPRDELHLVAEVEKLEDGLEIVPAIGPAPGDAKKQVELGGRGPAHQSTRQSRTAIRTTTSSLRRVTRSGRECPPGSLRYA